MPLKIEIKAPIAPGEDDDDKVKHFMSWWMDYMAANQITLSDDSIKKLVYYHEWIKNKDRDLPINESKVYNLFGQQWHDSDIYRFPKVHLVKTHFLLGNLRIAKSSLLEKFQQSLALPNIK